MRWFQDYLSVMTRLIPMPEIIERAWQAAPPGREAAADGDGGARRRRNTDRTGPVGAIAASGRLRG
jgi:hypothetical protein